MDTRYLKLWIGIAAGLISVALAYASGFYSEHSTALKAMYAGIVALINTQLVLFGLQFYEEVKKFSESASDKTKGLEDLLGGKLDQLRQAVTASSDRELQTLTASSDKILQTVTASSDSLSKTVEARTTVIHDYCRVMDEQLRSRLDEFAKRLAENAGHAATTQSLKMNLDELFDSVVWLTRDATTIDAVDIEINRWEEDTRGIRYRDANLESLKNGAAINRLFLIHPGTSVERFKEIETVMLKQAELRGQGKITLRALFADGIDAGHTGKDFALFRSTGAVQTVLYETFVDNGRGGWRSTCEGAVSKNPSDIDKYRTCFNYLWRLSENEPNGVEVKGKDSEEFARWSKRIKEKLRNA